MQDAFNTLTKRLESVERKNTILTKRIEYLEGTHAYPYYGYPLSTPPVQPPYLVTPPEILTSSSQSTPPVQPRYLVRPPPPEILTSSSHSESDSAADCYLLHKENEPPANCNTENKLEFDKGPPPVPVEAPMSKIETPLPPIQYDDLIKPQEVVMKYPTLLSASKIPTLAVRLAKEAYFGKYVMSFCTFRGIGSCHALPETEVKQMKGFLYQLCVPKYVTSKIEFECLYKKCVESVGQSCSYLRKLRLSNQKLV